LIASENFPYFAVPANRLPLSNDVFAPRGSNEKLAFRVAMPAESVLPDPPIENGAPATFPKSRLMLAPATGFPLASMSLTRAATSKL